MNTTRPNFRVRVFKTAYELMSKTGKEFAVCLAKAWALYRLRKRMYEEEVKIAFEKVDGSLRVATATLKGSADKIKGTGKTNYKAVRYIDVETGGFKSFKIENFITAYDE